MGEGIWAVAWDTARLRVTSGASRPVRFARDYTQMLYILIAARPFLIVRPRAPSWRKEITCLVSGFTLTSRSCAISAAASIASPLLPPLYPSRVTRPDRRNRTTTTPPNPTQLSPSATHHAGFTNFGRLLRPRAVLPLHAAALQEHPRRSAAGEVHGAAHDSSGDCGCE